MFKNGSLRFQVLALPPVTEVAGLIEKQLLEFVGRATVPAGFGSSRYLPMVDTVADPTCFIDYEGKIKKVEYQ